MIEKISIPPADSSPSRGVLEDSIASTRTFSVSSPLPLILVEEDGSGTPSGGTYLRTNKQTATAVNANRVPTLTCWVNRSEFQPVSTPIATTILIVYY